MAEDQSGLLITSELVTKEMRDLIHTHKRRGVTQKRICAEAILIGLKSKELKTKLKNL